jgi:hypothetical protein
MGRSLHAVSVVAFSTLGAFLCAGCGNGSGSTADSMQTAAGTAGASSGGSSSGGSSAAGSNSGGSHVGGNDTGGSHAGGSNSGGAAGGLSGCETAVDCPKITTPMAGVTQCLSPGQPAPANGCGAPQWCGQCACPPMPQRPLGTGMLCKTSTDCPAAMPGVPTASVCAMEQCAQCGSSADCPAELPQCASVQGGFVPGFRLCVACLTDTDCPVAKPHCAAAGAVSACVVCASTNDCAEGVCDNGACVPGCSSDKPCGNPLTECSAKQRCEAIACTGDGMCPPNTACATGHCQRRGCTGDAQCDQGACVNGICYETRGTCYTQMFFP